MKLKGVWIDEETGKLKAMPKLKLFPTSLKELFDNSAYETKEIILTREEAKKWGVDLKKNPKGYYTEIDGIRVPINIEN